MNKEQKEAYMKYCKYDKEPKEVILNLVEAIEKREKIIDKMAKYIDDTQMECNVYYKDKEDVKEYFKKEVEKECEK